MNEKKVTGASYLINFYQEIQQLTHHHSLLINLTVELGARYGNNFDPSKINESHKEVFIQYSQNLRYYAYKCYISLKSLSKELKLDKEKEKELETIYKELKTNFDIKSDDVEKYVITFNKIILNQAQIKKLLESSEDYINSIFAEKKDKE